MQAPRRQRTAFDPAGYWRSFDSAPPFFPSTLAQDDKEGRTPRTLSRSNVTTVFLFRHLGSSKSSFVAFIAAAPLAQLTSSPAKSAAGAGVRAGAGGRHRLRTRRIAPTPW